MNKKYCLISILFFLLMLVLTICLFSKISNTYVTMASIFIPIIFGAIINYDSQQKELYKLYYLPLYHYIKTYYDILSQPQEIASMGKKHEMLSSISKDLIDFLQDNLKYASEELNDMLSIIYFYHYENEKVQNEFQDVYNINRLIPIITKDLLEIYNVLHIGQYLKRKRYLNQKYQMVNGIVYLYVDSFLIDIARRKEYVIDLYECVEFYKKINNYRKKHFTDYYKIYKYIRKNRDKDINLLIKELNDNFNIKIRKINKLKK